MKLIRNELVNDMVVKTDFELTTSTKPVKFLLLSDMHIDNPKCDRKLLFKVLNQAVDENAYICIFGDLFCLMQGKGDPRKSKSDIRPEHNKANYIDAVIKDTASLLKPYANNILYIADGNHETSIVKHIEVDPIENLLGYLHKTNPEIIHMGYQGFNLITTSFYGSNYNTTVFFHHGAFSGPVTKGALSVSRYSSIVKSDVVVSGHTHDSWIIEHPFYELQQKTHDILMKIQYHVKTGTFKQEYLQRNGFQIEKTVMPKPMGGWWMDVTMKKSNSAAERIIRFTKAD
jgi:predicted phosphodiesterase